MSDERTTEIWFLIGSLNIGGANTVLVELANNLPPRYEVTVWTILDENPLLEQLDDSVAHRSLSASGKYDIISAIRFLHHLREGPDILHSFCLYDNLLASIAGVVHQDLTVITGIRSVPPEPSLRRMVSDWLSVRLADHVVSNSESGADLAKSLRSNSEHVHKIPNGRDLTEYANGHASESIYNELNIDRNSPIVGTVGRLLERKGHGEIISAWPQIKKRHPDAHLLIVGEGPYRSTLESLAKETGESKFIHLTGQRDDVPALLDAMDIFVFPSYFEGFPNAVMEAMAASLPIVATPVDGNAELITDGETGRFVSVENSAEIASIVNELLENRDTAAALGEAAQSHVLNRYTTDNMVASFEALYEQI